MKMKTKYFFMLFIACLMGVQGLNAQGNDRVKRPRKRMTMEQVSEMQSNRIVNELGLDDKTAARFKEVYKKYTTEMTDLRKKYASKKPVTKPGDRSKKPVLTDAEVDKRMKEHFMLSRKMLDIREKYYDEFRKFLSPKQVQKVYEQGKSNHGKVKKEMNRRAGMKEPKAN